ncbi:MAG: bifunctional 5,10-methylenetetrahydrofolate dehydrogenase/5,10-methenyltetrahydrofolate cyclohydrolase, partial [Clostridium sp.]
MIRYNAKELSQRILDEVKREITRNKYDIRLVIIQANDDNNSNLYINNKIKQCNYVRIKPTHMKLDEHTSTEDIIEIIKHLNEDDNVTGILVQLPLYPHLNEDKILNAIASEKDVDNLTQLNLGRLYTTNHTKYLPLTPLGIIEILKDNKIELKGKKATVIGRSVISGKSMALALLNEDCTVTICHSKTENLKEICKESDILVACIGKQVVDSSYIKDGSIICNIGYDFV